MRLAPGASTERVDVRDAAAVAALLTGARPDVVLHTAYRQDGPDAWEVNVSGSENVARAAAAVGARLVHLSTDVVFDGRKGSSYTESDEPSPCSDYGRSKAEAERRVAARPPRRVDRADVTHRRRAGARAVEARDRAHMTQACDVLRGRAALAGAGDRSRPGAARARRARRHRAAARRGPGRRLAAELAELVTGRPVRRAPRRRAPLDCRLDSSRARSLLRTNCAASVRAWLGHRRCDPVLSRSSISSGRTRWRE